MWVIFQTRFHPPRDTLDSTNAPRSGARGTRRFGRVCRASGVTPASSCALERPLPRSRHGAVTTRWVARASRAAAGRRVATRERRQRAWVTLRRACALMQRRAATAVRQGAAEGVTALDFSISALEGGGGRRDASAPTSPRPRYLMLSSF